MIPPATSPAAIFFGEFDLDDALGVMLAHSLQLPDRKLRKGHLLEVDDLDRLRHAGIVRIAGARLGSGALAENPAAAAIANLLAGPGTVTRSPAGGRCNVHARHDGILSIDRDAIVAANRLGEEIAIGTLLPDIRVRAGQVVATVKIIPCGIAQSMLAACQTTLNARPPLAVAPLLPRRVALIVSILDDSPDHWPATIATVTRQRLESLGSRLALSLRCRHDVAAIATRLREARAAGCELVLIGGAAGTKDRRDTAPAAIVAAGGHIERFGMPVEPGNMLLLGRMNELPVVVMPGCARSRRLNGLDWVLQRLLANLPLNDDDFAATGVGGLIRHADSQLAEPADSPTTVGAPSASPRIAALLLAAGASRRMGAGRHKLLEDIEGIPMVKRAVNAALASRASSVTVVTGAQADAIAAKVSAAGVRLIHNPDHATGMASSLRCGLTALGEECDAVLIMLADMPMIDASHLDRLLDAYRMQARPTIVAPVHDGRRGNPVIWPRQYFADLMALAGDEGARRLLHSHESQTALIEMDTAAIFFDIDTPADLADCRQRD